MRRPTMPEALSATYRVQLNAGFGFADLKDCLEYFSQLGIDAVYLSPVLRARHGSSHGYDVVDHSELNPELGGPDHFEAMAMRLEELSLGLLLDIVPNHMCVTDPANHWWQDVLENGLSSPYAGHFDIDWTPPKTDLDSKILLPILGDQYGRVLENGEIVLGYQDGAFHVNYWDLRLPVAPRTWRHILEPLCEVMATQLPSSDTRLQELLSILTALRHLPDRDVTDPASVAERRREKEVVRRRLAAAVSEDTRIERELGAIVTRVNGNRGAPRSFDALEALLSDQGYRLSYWRVACDEINYRRFFDINELAAINVEVPEVFAAVHAQVLRLFERGVVVGARIDHVDGLRDPAGYLHTLHDAIAAVSGTAAPWVVVEKILQPKEKLRQDWPVGGTTGYGFMNQLMRLFVASTSTLDEVYQEFTGQRERFEDVLYESKKLALHVSLSSELTVLARKLDRISEQHRHTRDFTLATLQEALAEVVACFPVYRTYVRPGDGTLGEQDRKAIDRAVDDAEYRNPAVNESIFEFIRAVLLLERFGDLTEENMAEREDFVLRFQQLTSPVMAKGLEDTAFYRYFPIAAANEVGGDPDPVPLDSTGWCEFCQQRLQIEPCGLSATSTHDTKRSEDLRARLCVLSEIPSDWREAIYRWSALAARHKVLVDRELAPSRDEELFIYQTIVGALPPKSKPIDGQFVERITEYLRKAMREAKLRTSWVNPDVEHEDAVLGFAATILDAERSPELFADICEFVRHLEPSGYLTALSQLVLKLAAPGIPDIYQGTELWSLALVDPDNRRPVDFALRKRMLVELTDRFSGDPLALIEELLQTPEDGRIKALITWRGLQARRSRPDLFRSGAVLPVEVTGPLAGYLVAQGRALQGQSALVVTGRFFTALGMPAQLPVGEPLWAGNTLRVPSELAGATYVDVFSGRRIPVSEAGIVAVGEILRHLPQALLVRDDAGAA